MRITAWWHGISPRRRLLLGGVVTAVVAALAVTGFVATRLAHAPRDGVPDQAKPGPVLLIPGYGGGQGALNQLATRIRQATGRIAEVLTLAGDGTGDLAEQAGVLADAVARAYAAGAPSVDVVG